MSHRPYVWEMVEETVINLDDKASYSEIRDYIKHYYEVVNENTITAQTKCDWSDFAIHGMD